MKRSISSNVTEVYDLTAEKTRGKIQWLNKRKSPVIVFVFGFEKVGFLHTWKKIWNVQSYVKTFENLPILLRCGHVTWIRLLIVIHHFLITLLYFGCIVKVVQWCKFMGRWYSQWFSWKIWVSKQCSVTDKTKMYFGSSW